MVITGSPQPKCPTCGGARPMVTWTGGEPPECAACAGATVVGNGFLGTKRRDNDGCLHDALERSRPPNRKGDPHMLVCNCPKCSIIC